MISEKYVRKIMCVILISAVTCAYAEKPEDIWAKMQNGEIPRNNFKILENYPLLVKVPEVGTDAVALNSVLYYYLEKSPSPNADFFLAATLEFPDKLSKKLGKEKYHPGKRYWEYVNSKVINKVGRRVKKVRAATKDKKEIWKTVGAKNSYLIEDYLSDVSPARDLSKATRKFAEERYFSVCIRESDTTSWEDIKDAIDKKIPVILQHASKVFVVVGYYTDNKEKYVFLYDPEKAEFHIATGKEVVSKKDLESKKEWIRNAVKHMLKYKIPRDALFSLKSSFPPGVELKNMDELKSYSSLYVYDWKIDENKLDSELKQIVNNMKLKKGEKIGK